jgi:threonine synthase
VSRARTRGVGVIERYREHLPVGADTPIVSLGEGDTPLFRSERLSRATGADVWLKYEGANPTGSFKDRGMTVAVSRAMQDGAQAVVCASTGNTSASAAAYAARAGLACGVLVPQGGVALGKLAQALVHGARVFEIDGSFDTALRMTRDLAAHRGVAVVNSVNPHRIEGQKTAAFEIVEALGRAPDIHVMPVGNAGNITAYGRGYDEARAAGWSTTVPRIFGVQAEGADPIVRGAPIEHPQTRASAIRVGNPASWAGAVEVTRTSGGAMFSVADDAIAAASRALAAEGVFAELAAAAGVAGLEVLAHRGKVAHGALAVCVVTGHGLKDPGWVLEDVDRPERAGPNARAVLDALDLR